MQHSIKNIGAITWTQLAGLILFVAVVLWTLWYYTDLLNTSNTAIGWLFN